MRQPQAPAAVQSPAKRAPRSFNRVDRPERGYEQTRLRVEAAACAAVQGYFDDPLNPPAAESVTALPAAISDLLYVTCPAQDAAAHDGVHLALITREGDSALLTGGVSMLGGVSGCSMRPMAADLSRVGDSTIRIGAISEEINWRPQQS